jgi:hypothetical protein
VKQVVCLLRETGEHFVKQVSLILIQGMYNRSTFETYHQSCETGRPFVNQAGNVKPFHTNTVNTVWI